MKKTILISFLLLSCTLFYGQGTSYNLGFSQVKLVGNTTETVPPGKVWKITNVMPSTSAYNGNVDITVNGNEVRVKARDYVSINNIEGTAMSSWTALSGAYWLPAGTTLAANTNCEYISVVEFNVE